MKMRCFLIHFSILLLILNFPISAIYAQEQLTLKRFTGAITLDGLSNEAAWNNIDPLPLTMYKPTFKGTPTEKSEIRITYDDNFLYASARFYDSDPSGIHSNSLYRDRNRNDDIFNLILDTFNDKENALGFWTTPSGVRGDNALSNDAQTNNLAWNTFWDVSTVQNDEGWFAEMRIPFSSLGFSIKDDEITIGIITFRYIDRKNEFLIFPEISPDYQLNAPSKAQEFILKDIQTQNPVYITPYLLGGVGKYSKMNDSGTEYISKNEDQQEMGLDVKYNLTNNLTIDATINTDFAQIEADDEVVNLSRFSVFFPEKRQFFQERSGIFEFRTTGLFSRDRLFHSRNIGINDGKAVSVLGGVRLVGREGPWDIGALSMQTKESTGLPSENFSIMRLRRQMLNENSYTGGMVTSRLGDDGSYNIAYGLDSILRLYNNEYLTLKWAQTIDDDINKAGSMNFMDASSFLAYWEKRVMMGWNYRFSYTRSGKDFMPEVGYTTRRDYSEYAWQVQYDKFEDEDSRLRKYSLMQVLGAVATRNTDGTVESSWAEWGTDCSWKSGSFFWFDMETYYEDLRNQLSFPEGTYIPIGNYHFYRLEGGYRTQPGRLLSANTFFTVGSFYDGWNQTFGVTPTWSISRHMRIQANYSVNFVSFPDRDQKFNSHIVSTRIQGALNNKFSVNGFIQYNSIADQLTPNIRFRYNFREGNDFWLVYNEGINTDREKVDPILPRSDNRTIMMKYTYTFKK